MNARTAMIRHMKATCERGRRAKAFNEARAAQGARASGELADLAKGIRTEPKDGSLSALATRHHGRIHLAVPFVVHVKFDGTCTRGHTHSYVLPYDALGEGSRQVFCKEPGCFLPNGVPAMAKLPVGLQEFGRILAGRR